MLDNKLGELELLHATTGTHKK